MLHWIFLYVYYDLSHLSNVFDSLFLGSLLQDRFHGFIDFIVTSDLVHTVYLY